MMTIDILAILKQAQESLEESLDIVQRDYDDNWRHGIPSRKAQIDALAQQLQQHKDSITNLTAAIEQIEKAEPVALVVASEFGSIPKFLANGKDHPKVGTLLYPLPAAPKECRE